jgi:DMATS type aromatic prenyltransferase
MSARSLTLFDEGTATFTRLAKALELGEEASTLIASLIAPLKESATQDGPAWPSDISDDHTPFELSLALSERGPEARCLFEAKGSGGDNGLPARATAARTLNRQLAERYPLDLSRLTAIEDLFLPKAPHGSWAMWHAVAFRKGRAPEFRVYLNPHASGPGRAGAVIEEALGRLGFHGAFGTLLNHALRRGPELDDLRYFSLDLTATEARVKVYVFHEDSDAALLEEAARAAHNYAPGEVGDFCRLMAGPGPWRARPIATCYAFTAADRVRPLTSTVHVPIRAYAPDDRIAAKRLLAYADHRAVGPADLQGAIDAVAHRPLAAGSGLITYASMRAEGNRPRLTAYLAVECYATDPPRTEPVATLATRPTPTPESVVRRREAEPLTDHPFFQRMKREPVDLAHMWRLFTNIRSGLSQHFPRRLAAVVARVTDERIRSLLAKQLDEELGEGDYTKAHIILFDDMLAGLSAYKPATVDALDYEAGRVLEQQLEVPYADPDGHVGVGAAMVIEVFGKQVDRFVADQFRRQQAVAPDTLTWLHLHENLELEHAEESVDLARLVPATEEAQAAVARGARQVFDAGWLFFDHMYRACWR